jgi:hypothetical protein
VIAPLLLTTLLALPAQGAKFRLERVELLADDTGAWLNYDLPMLGAHPLMVGFRLVEQTQLVWALPIENLKVGTGLESITVSYERSMSVDLAGGDLGWYGGLTTRLLMPRGATAGVDWTKKRLRLAAGASMTSASTWARPGWGVWSPMPVLSVGLVTGKAEDKRFRSAPVDRTEFRQDSAAPVEGSTTPAEGTAPPVEGAAAPVEGSTPPAEGSTPPAEGTARELPSAEEVPPTPQGVVLPTGPTAVEFGAPTQVVMPGDGPTQVQIGGGDDSSQEDDAKEEGD